MSDYHALLLFGALALLVGAIRYVRLTVDGRSGVVWLLLTLAGGGALFAAESVAPEGVSAGDLVPAVQDLLTAIGRIFL